MQQYNISAFYQSENVLLTKSSATINTILGGLHCTSFEANCCIIAMSEKIAAYIFSYLINSFNSITLLIKNSAE